MRQHHQQRDRYGKGLGKGQGLDLVENGEIPAIEQRRTASVLSNPQGGHKKPLPN